MLNEESRQFPAQLLWQGFGTSSRERDLVIFSRRCLICYFYHAWQKSCTAYTSLNYHLPSCGWLLVHLQHSLQANVSDDLQWELKLVEAFFSYFASRYSSLIGCAACLLGSTTAVEEAMLWRRHLSGTDDSVHSNKSGHMTSVYHLRVDKL